MIPIDAKNKAVEERNTFAQDLIELCKDESTLLKGTNNLKKRMLINLNLVQSNAVLKDEKLLVELKPVFYELAKLAKNNKWYPQANSNRCLHSESIAFVSFLGVIWVKNFTDLTQLISIFILILLG